MRAATLLVCLLLAACASRAEVRARDIQAASDACADMGYQPQTEGHRACVQNLYLQKQQARSQGVSDAAAVAAAAALAPPVQAPVTCRWFAGRYVCQ